MGLWLIDGVGVAPPEKEEGVRPAKRAKIEKEPEVIEKPAEEGPKELHVTLSPYSPNRDPPEPEELIKALMVWQIVI